MDQKKRQAGRADNLTRRELLLDGKRVLACGTPIIKADRRTLTSV